GVLRGEGLPDLDPAECPPRRGAVVREANPPLRRAVGRREELPLGCRRADQADRCAGEGRSREGGQVSQNKRLGRGLEALLGPRSREEAVEQGALREVPVEAIVANPWQPRREFDELALQELTDSIKASGLLQPPVVRPAGSG